MSAFARNAGVLHLRYKAARKLANGPGAPKGNRNAAKGEKNNPDNVRVESTSYGNRADYIRARLERDAPGNPAAKAALDAAADGAGAKVTKALGEKDPTGGSFSQPEASAAVAALARNRRGGVAR